MDGKRSWSGRTAVTALGLLTVAFWLSRAVFPQPIPPFVPLPNMESMLGEIAPWIRQRTPGLDRPDSEVLAALRRELVWTYAQVWLKIGFGVVAGFLMARRNPLGRWIAIILCGFVLNEFLVSQGRLVGDGRLIAFWRALAHYAVGQFIWRVVDMLFLSGTLVYLTRRPVALQFARTAPDAIR